jgi:hypothetical protein
MWDFISVMADYIWERDGSYDKTILTTLADLEDSDTFEHSEAEGKELARRVLDFVNGKADLSVDDAKSFQKVMQTRPQENIERLLSRALEKGADEFGPGVYSPTLQFRNKQNVCANWFKHEHIVLRELFGGAVGTSRHKAYVCHF